MRALSSKRVPVALSRALLPYPMYITLAAKARRLSATSDVSHYRNREISM